MRITTELGTIGISNRAVEAIAENAAATCIGVRGTDAPGLQGRLLSLVGIRQQCLGVNARSSENGMLQIDLHLAVERGVSIRTICQNLKDQVGYEVEKCTGVPVQEVNLYIDAIR
ncbi:MAG: Asp23/Gls24 family envelope stress response protein [Clostridiaceae bacterium]|nr:Asp23/Gls24 family envelope stress response protein [Clostridiaceae bacterium]